MLWLEVELLTAHVEEAEEGPTAHVPPAEESVAPDVAAPT